MKALSRPIPYYQPGEVGEEKRAYVSQGLCFSRFAGRWHCTIRIRICVAAASHDTMPLRAPYSIQKSPKPQILAQRFGVWGIFERSKCVSSFSAPSGPEERGANIAARQFLSLNCLASTLTARVILKEEKSPLLWARDSWEGILGDNLGEGNCESLSRDSGETIFAARHQDVSQRPLGPRAN